MFKFVYISSPTGLWNFYIHCPTTVLLNTQAFFTNSTNMFVTAFTPWKTITNTTAISGGEQCICIQQHKGMSVNIKFSLASQARSIHRLKHVTHNAQPETNI